MRAIDEWTAQRQQSTTRAGKRANTRGVGAVFLLLTELELLITLLIHLQSHLQKNMPKSFRRPRLSANGKRLQTIVSDARSLRVVLICTPQGERRYVAEVYRILRTQIPVMSSLLFHTLIMWPQARWRLREVWLHIFISEVTRLLWLNFIVLFQALFSLPLLLLLTEVRFLMEKSGGKKWNNTWDIL